MKYLILSLLLIVLWSHKSHSGCSYSDSRHIKCNSINKREMLDVINNGDCGGLDSLIVEDSYITQIEIGPRCNNFGALISRLILRNSQVTKFSMNSDVLRKLDLSFNYIHELPMIRAKYLEELVLHHNQLHSFDRSESFPNLVFLDLSYNNIDELAIPPKSYGIRFLNMSHNSIKEIGALFSASNTLQNIDLSYNKLRNIFTRDFRNLDRLEYLNLTHNEIQFIECDIISPIISLQFWRIPNKDLSYNKLNQLDFLCNYYCTNYCGEWNRLVKLSSLDLQNNEFYDLIFMMKIKTKISVNSINFRKNKISKLYPYNFKNCTVGILDLSLNDIESIPPSTFEGSIVEKLYLDHNKIEYLNDSSLTGLENLRMLNLSYNPLKTLSEMVLRNLSLNILDLSHCLITKIPQVKLRKFSEIYLNNNNINSIEPNVFYVVDILDLSNNNIHLQTNVFSRLKVKMLSNNHPDTLKKFLNGTEKDNMNLTEITIDKLSRNDLRGLSVTEYLDLSNCGIKHLENNSFDQLIHVRNINLNDNSIEIIPNYFFQFNTNLEYLSLLRNPLKFIPLDAFPQKNNLKYLFLTMNGSFLERQFFNLTLLEELHFVDSKITQLQKNSFAGLSNLKKLTFKNSTVLDIEPGAFSGLVKVLDLTAHSETSQSEYFSGLRSLQRLNLSGIGITKIEEGDFTGLFMLMNLTLNDNKIKVLPERAFIGLESLEYLDLSVNEITEIENGAFTGLNNIGYLNLSHNRICCLGKNSLVGLKYLQMLDLSYNSLSLDLGTVDIFRHLIQLTHLHLQHNEITSTYPGIFSNLRNLKFLNLSQNKLENLDATVIYPLKKLELLDINSNQFGYPLDHNLILQHVKSLKTIGIGGNHWYCPEMIKMLNNFEDHNLDYIEISYLELNVTNIEGIRCS